MNVAYDIILLFFETEEDGWKSFIILVSGKEVVFSFIPVLLQLLCRRTLHSRLARRAQVFVRAFATELFWVEFRKR